MLTQVAHATGQSDVDFPCLARSAVPGLCTLAANGLIAMLDPEKHLFCYRLKQTPQGLVREGISHRYTTMSILGLHRFEAGGLRSSPVHIARTFETLLADLAWVKNIGDLGLLLWVCATVGPDCLEKIYFQLRVPDALDRFRGSRKGVSMELAWLLSGLAHAKLCGRQRLPGLADLAARTYTLLQSNQGKHGFFGHSAARGSFTGGFRGRIGSFADQVYPIYAFAKFGQAFRNRAALQSALACAEAICRAQGPLGQWWWHYDSLTGRILQRYPVYSVHQHGMAPMALFAVSEATGVNFDEPIYRGLAWIDGNNECRTSLRLAASDLVWRSAYRPGKLKMYLREFRDFLTPADRFASASDLQLKFECRPYELGWLLYAFCGPEVQ